MKFKLIDEDNNKNSYSIEEIIFTNRGIKKEEIYNFLNTKDEDILDFSLLNNIDKAYECIIKHLQMDSKILIQVD